MPGIVVGYPGPLHRSIVTWASDARPAPAADWSLHEDLAPDVPPAVSAPMTPWFRARLNALLGKPGLPCPYDQCPIRKDECLGRIFPITLEEHRDRPLGRGFEALEDRDYWKCDAREVFFAYKDRRFTLVPEETR